MLFMSISLKYVIVRETASIVRRSAITTEEKICIRLDLEGQEAKGFSALRKCRGLTNNTELVRLLIREAEEKAKIVLGKEA